MYLPKLVALSLSVGRALARATIGRDSTDSVVSSCGQETIIPAWDIQSSARATNDLANLSRPGLDTSTWYHINTSRCTLMGCLLEAQVYEDTELFFSDNLKNVNQDEFLVPWLYRHEFPLRPGTGRHYFLQTNGVTSRADIFLNGHQIADKTVQSGAYGGRTFDISTQVGQKNALVIQVYPTNYFYDFALGFVDWNPYPADNGSGVWRDVTIKQTGSVHLGPLHVTTKLDLPIKKGSSAVVTLKATAQNLETHDVSIVMEALVSRESGSQPRKFKQSLTLRPLESKEVTLSTTVENAAIWWPKQWGDQPLYTAQLSCMVDGQLSDSAKRTFGIRTVTSLLNSHNDTLFSINGYPFQVIGGGYAADMFLRWDSERFTTQAQYMLDMGLNTVRLEGMMEQPELYEIADRMGLMVIAGWECCNKWESWSYNGELTVDPVPVWDDNDYETANASMIHEASMLQSHPSMLAFMVGSDFWPDDRATSIYVNALQAASWQNPIISSAAQRGYPKLLGPSGMKMAGPYDWVPPNYWYDTEPASERLGAAFSFGSELGAGVGTPELGSLKKFLTEADMNDIWQEPDAGLYHMSTSTSQFYHRAIYNDALRHRYGTPSSLDEYLLKAQMMDYEATRAEFEGYSTRWNAKRPATGLIYWMLNNAWPSLHWNLFDYYLHPAGSYFGTKVGSRMEHVAYDYVQKAVYLINHSLDRQGKRAVAVEVMDLNGKALFTKTLSADTAPNTSKSILDVSTQLGNVTDVVFLRLLLQDDKKKVLSRNVYWIANTIDSLDWDNSTWYHTPVTKYADYSALNQLQTTNISVTASKADHGKRSVTLENKSSLPAFFIRLNLVDGNGADVVPVFWSDNYVTLWPGEKLELKVSYGNTATRVEVSGGNVPKVHVDLS